MKSIRKLAAASLLAGAAALAPSFLAWGQTAGQDMHQAGSDTKNAAKDTGHGISRGTKTAYRKTKHGTKKAYHKTKSGTAKAYDATKDRTENAGDAVAGKPATH